MEIHSKDLTEDSYVFGYNGGNSTSFGSENTIRVESWKVVEDMNSNFYDNIIYLKFNYDQLLSSAAIFNAFITLYVDTANYNAVPKYATYGHRVEDSTKRITISNVTSAWTESTLNYFNQPSSTNLYATQQTISKQQFQEYRFNVTELVKEQLAKGNNGFKIALTNSSGHNLLRFASSENAYPLYCPRMFISYK